MIKDKIVFPRKRKGRLKKDEKIEYETKVKQFGADLQALEFEMLGIKSTENIPEKLKTSTRGWCYLLEVFGIIDKDEFDIGDVVIGYCRKVGYLPIDFVAIDNTRGWYNVEPLKKEYKEPKQWIIDFLNDAKKLYKLKDDISFWESQKYYIQFRTEKIDIRNLFNDIFRACHIPASNARGWSDINSWNLMAQRYKQAEEMGLIPILLYYQDHDPMGIKIGETIMSNLKDLENATGWNPDNLIVDVFGLSFKFIEDNGLRWIDNLITGSGRKVGEIYERYKAGTMIKGERIFNYEISYIDKYGVRKCEANAIVTVRKAAQTDCIKAIQRYLWEDGRDPFEEYNKKLEEDREKTKDVLDSVEY